MRRILAKITLAALLAASLGAAPALAGGALETVDVTAGTPSPRPGELTGKLVRIFWDPRCIPVKYLMNNTLDPIPNPLPPNTPVLSLAAATTALQGSFNRWNSINTSYINSQIVGTVANLGNRGFDMKNELTFRTAASFTAIASSPSVSFVTDVTLVHGDLIDNDADPDVSSAITTCQDVDGDGDIEFPAGFYRAGTIVDNDVQFNTKTSNGLRFTTADAAADTVTRSVDLDCVATHEFGHSFGLSHVLDNNKSATDGNGTTMYPFIDTGDPASELSQRTIEEDDIAWASYFYPEGSAASGPAALQSGDVSFDSVYGLITGEVTHGVLNQPLAGASVAAFRDGSSEFFSAGFSGTTQASYNPLTGQIFLLTPPNPAYHLIDGKYTIPVKKGNWNVRVEAVDGNPVGVGSISATAQIGSSFGQHNFNEEFWNGNNEGALEKRFGEAKNVHVNEGEVETGIDFVTNADIRINNFGTRDFIGFTLSPGGRIYAVRIPASQFPAQDVFVQAVLYDTSLVDASTLPLFAEAMLTTGSVSGSTVSIDLANPLEKVTGFLGADNDFAPFFFKNPHELGKRIRREIDKGDITDLFLVLQVPPSPFPGVSAIPPLIGLDGGVALNDVPIFGLSYLSDNGGATFSQVTNFNFRFGLLLSQAN